jgi:hypothetical protein
MVAGLEVVGTGGQLVLANQGGLGIATDELQSHHVGARLGLTVGLTRRQSATPVGPSDSA